MKNKMPWLLCAALLLTAGDVSAAEPGGGLAELLPEAARLDLSTIDRDVWRRLVEVNRDFARLGVLHTFWQALGDPDAALLHLRLNLPSDKPSPQLADGSYISLRPWSQKVFELKGDVFQVLDVLAGKDPGFEYVVVMLKEGRGEIDLTYPARVLHGAEMIVALRPHEDQSLAGGELTVYKLYGQTLFSQAITAWPYPEIPPYFGGLFSGDELRELTELLASGTFKSWMDALGAEKAE